ncbi:MAG: thiaminase II [Candidatus Latescibacteria bacterium]|nr:thiaminase II [bacterium]MBD3424035.1 thiaminase II [Candidatus Latescibacterota bacterium]
MKLSDRLRQDSETIWKKIYNHPFVVELFDGTLPERKFRFYILQDYNYLISSIKNFSLLASRAPDEKSLIEVAEMAYMEATGEFEGYRSFLEKMGLSVEEAQGQEMMQTGLSYVSFLLSTSSLKTFQEGMAAVLPCYWSYQEIAAYHGDKIRGMESEIYREWASYYLEDEYIELVDRIRALVDRTGTGFPYEKLREVFINASRYELNFWDAVYREGIT